MIVLPTGGGKTYTMSMWLLKNALDQKKKILWIAHRQMLLDQAAESFQKFAYSEVIPHIPFFQYRIISGASCHDRMIDIHNRQSVDYQQGQCWKRHQRIGHLVKRRKGYFPCH